MQHQRYRDTQAIHTTTCMVTYYQYTRTLQRQQREQSTSKATTQLITYYVKTPPGRPPRLHRQVQRQRQPRAARQVTSNTLLVHLSIRVVTCKPASVSRTKKWQVHERNVYETKVSHTKTKPRKNTNDNDGRYLCERKSFKMMGNENDNTACLS